MLVLVYLANYDTLFYLWSVRVFLILRSFCLGAVWGLKMPLSPPLCCFKVYGSFENIRDPTFAP